MNTFLTMSEHVSPVSTTSRERSEWIDALRGFALLGILLANIVAFSGYIFLDPNARAELPWNQGQDILNFLEQALVQSKFYSMFSFLFGLGFMIQLSRAEANGDDFKMMHSIRMAWLLMFGLAHFFLVWFGDILILYAVMGFALLLFYRLSNRALLTWAMVFLSAPFLLYLVYLGYLHLTDSSPYTISMAEGMAHAFEASANGSYPEVVEANSQLFGFSWEMRIYRFQLFRVFGMFLLGAWAGRIGLPFARGLLRPMFKQWLIWGLVIGLPLNLAYASINLSITEVWKLADAKGVMMMALDSIGVPLLTLAYVAVFGLYWRQSESGNQPHLLVASGRMPLTHYLSQSIVCVLVFYGFGFGFNLFGRTSLGMGIIFALAIYLALATLCRIWLKYHRHGPMEILWRRARVLTN